VNDRPCVVNDRRIPSRGVRGLPDLGAALLSICIRSYEPNDVKGATATATCPCRLSAFADDFEELVFGDDADVEVASPVEFAAGVVPCHHEVGIA